MAQALKSFVLKKGNYRDWVVSGGGTKNASLMEMLRKEAKSMGLLLRHSDDFGIPSQAKEAVAFALLAYQTFKVCRAMCLRLRELSDLRCWEKFPMFKRLNHKGHKGSQRLVQSGAKHLRVPSCPLWLKLFCLLLCVSMLSCSKRPDANTVVMIIESSPTNLDPRVGTDAQSERSTS